MALDLAAIFRATCERYGVAIHAGPVPSDRQGPREPGCDPARRIVYVTAQWDDPSRRGRSVHREPEAYIHELAHVVCQPPGVSIDVVPEDWILMQWERTFTREVMPAAIADLVRWQEDTIAPLCAAPSEMLGEVEGYQRCAPWLRGYARACRVGLLDDCGAPTWAWPRWDALRRGEIKAAVAEAWGA